MTFEQLERIDPSTLKIILLRYRAHFLAYEVFTYLELDQEHISAIQTDWACCIVKEKRKDKPE